MHYDEEKKEFSYDEDVLAIFTNKSKPEEEQKVDWSEITFEEVGIDQINEKEKAADPVDTGETVIFASQPKPNNEETVLFTSNENKAELGSGLAGEAVIDREEWDKIVAQVDAQQAKEAEMSTQAKSEKEKGEKGKMNTKKKKKKKKGHFWRNLLIILLSLCLIGGIVVGVIVSRIIKDTPPINPDNIYDLLSENSVLLDASGNIIDNIYKGGSLRTNVEYNDLPQDLVWALVCTEDKTFFTHKGFNFVRIVGAVWDTVKSGFKVRIGGTSTITQQLARNVYLTETKSARKLEGLIRKIQEAYYTVIIERALTKEQILEAYLNTIYLGFNSDGVQAAAQAYFSKDVKDLSLIECAVLATLPQSPNKYAPLKRAQVDSFIEEELEAIDIVDKSDVWVTYYNDSIETRVKLVLKNMLAQGKLSQEVYDSIDVHEQVRASLNPGSTVESAEMASSYFKDYIIDQVVGDLQEKLGYTYDEASDLLYTGGLIINSTLNLDVQNIIEGIYADPANFPTITLANLDVDSQKNICYPDSRNIMLYEFNNMIEKDGTFKLKKSEYEVLPNGDLKIYKGNRLGIYKTQVGDEIEIACEFKNMYIIKDKLLYSISGGYWNIDTSYKQRDDEGNFILSHKYFEDKPEAFTFNDDGTITMSSDYFVLRDEIIQPQSAMVIIENETGAIRGMVGGRNIVGKKLYNRAIKPRQTGSSIKPLAVYSLALQKGFDNAKANAEQGLTGDEALPVYTAATPLDDIPMNMNGKLWPAEFNEKYIGATYLRYAVQHSLNCCSVSLFMNALSPWESITNLQKLGVTTLVTTGPTNDVNAAALALGGFSTGISPLEMCSAYSTFGNYGEHLPAICYTTITNKKGDVILASDSTPERVYDEEVASLTLDVLYSVVNGGGASAAKIKSQPAAGKTGTTTDNYDLWFCGLTPKYSATVWIGSDMNLYIKGSSSGNATKVFKLVMEEVGKLDEKEEFELRGEFVTCSIDSRTGLLSNEFTPEEFVRSEIFIKGTEPTEYSNAEIPVEICVHSGYLATDICRNNGCVTTKYFTPRIGGLSWETLLASYTIHETRDIEFTSDGKQFITDEEGTIFWYDKETNSYKNYAGDVAELDYLVEDKSVYLDIVPDAVYDPPEFYCPYHNYDTETYPISPLYEHKVYDPWAQQGEGEQTETGEGETQTGEGQTEFVPSADNPVL